MRKAWEDGERVLSLKMAIQSAQLLSEKSVNECPPFFPSLFVVVAEILDCFGGLVFQRLNEKALTGESEDDWNIEDVPLEALETSKNWIYKTCCIRELSPRIFIQLSIFRCLAILRSLSFLVISTENVFVYKVGGFCVIQMIYKRYWKE